MDGLGASRCPATPDGDSRGPMSQSCLLCLPMHSSCDPTTCSSLLLFGSDPSTRTGANSTPYSAYCLISTTLGQITKAASKGCFVCATLYTGLKASVQPLASYAFDMTSPVHVSDGGHVRIQHQILTVVERSLSFYAIKKATDISRHCLAFPQRYHSTGTDSDTSFDQIKDWMQKCKTHTHCPTDVNPVMPTRVLDIGDHAGLDIKLIETSGKRGPYIALSHCWGRVQLIQTTSESFTERQRGILFSLLPKTFQEAIFISRRLGYRHLWIDSLCIIQDDLADWQRESARMADVYSNAVLTLAASASENSQGGFFRDTPGLSGSNSWKISVHYNSPDGDAMTPMPTQKLNKSHNEVTGSDSDWLEDLTEQQLKTGGHARSIFYFSGHQTPVVSYLPVYVQPVSLSRKTSSSNVVDGPAEVSKRRAITRNRPAIVGTKLQSDQSQKPLTFRGKFECLEHSTEVYMRNSERFDHGEFLDITSRDPESSRHLSMRAWTLQERLLSTRILHFTGMELVWECKTATYCQCGLVMLERGMQSTCTTGQEDVAYACGLLKMSFEHSLHAASEGDIKHIRSLWYKLVVNFSGRSLTSSGDRLPAISGLAKRLEQAAGGEYIAGMWRKWLPQYMVWTRSWQTGHVEKTRHAAYIAPTWSWASITCDIYFPGGFVATTKPVPLGFIYPEFDIVAEIIDVQYAAAGLDPRGPLSHGVLTVRAPVLSARMRQSTKLYQPRLEPFEIVHLHTGATMAFYADNASEIDTSIEEHDVLCIQWTKAEDIPPIVQRYRAVGDLKPAFILKSFGLVLRRSIGAPDKYERVGLVIAEREYSESLGFDGSTAVDEWFKGADVRMLDLI